MTKVEDVKRLDAIVDGASKLPVENQEYILTTIKGMLFTRNLLLKQAEQPRRPPEDHPAQYISPRNFPQSFKSQFVQQGGNWAGFRKIHLPTGKEKTRIHAGLQDFGSYGKEGK